MEQRTTRWRCSVCSTSLELVPTERRWLCSQGHSFDVAREGYVNLLLAQQRRSRIPGDPPEMVWARERFLATGLYRALTETIVAKVSSYTPRAVLDVGCGEGHHTRALEAPEVLAFDVAKIAVAHAAKRDQRTSYAVANAASVPLADGVVDLCVNIFGPIDSSELARVLPAGGVVVAAHPAHDHLKELRSLVYRTARPHVVKDPLRDRRDLFQLTDTHELRYRFTINEPTTALDLFTMTPYRWHAVPQIEQAIIEQAEVGFELTADFVISVYRRTAQPLLRELGYLAPPTIPHLVRIQSTAVS
ncbi:MAG: putative RNA methyltransferase [Acidimicrobiales bacterium]